jgi:hypothetical protein
MDASPDIHRSHVQKRAKIDFIWREALNLLLADIRG